MLNLLVFCFCPIVFAQYETVLMTEVFKIAIKPHMFNWTYDYKDASNQYVYQPSLKEAPDLPEWMNYVYSERHRAGFLYGVPSNIEERIEIDIVALNRKDYSTRINNITIHVSEKLNPAKNEVHMKINKRNVDDMFDVETMENLKDIFRNFLWKESQDDLYLTFLASAVELGARKPLNPEQGEGVVLKLGSKANFSRDLKNLQEEVKPIWKLPNCNEIPKRTSFERYFRDAGFSMDWCSFRLTNEELSGQGTNVEKLTNIEESLLQNNIWSSINRDEVPARSYSGEFLLTILVPLIIMILLVLLLSFILCFHHEGIEDPFSDEFFEHIFDICLDYVRSEQLMKTPHEDMSQYATIHRATHTLRSLSNNRDEFACLSPESVLLSRSHTNSPTSTINRGVHCRPSPPPYIRPKNKPNF